MITHKEIYFSDFSVKELHDLVLDIESYPEFLPWCSAARIIESSDNKIIAELVVHFASFHEKYTSEVTVVPPNDTGKYSKINVEMIEGPFNKLNNIWVFEHDSKKNKTMVKFNIDFEFKSVILQKMMGAMFGIALKKMMSSFEERAKEIYG